jgi:hypothetical protein
MKLVKKICELELQLQNEKSEKNKREKKHRENMKMRDGKEITYVYCSSL